VAFDESLAAYTRDALAPSRGVRERKMFGGLGFLIRGNRRVGV
jgi:hypothetical protein